MTLDSHFGVSALERARIRTQPEIFTSDQGAQCTSLACTEPLLARGIRISRDGRGRVVDNIFVERRWRSMKDEEVYLKDYRSVPEAIHGLWGYVEFDNRERFHQSLHDQTPAAVYRQGQKWAAVATVN